MNAVLEQIDPLPCRSISAVRIEDAKVEMDWRTSTGWQCETRFVEQLKEQLPNFHEIEFCGMIPEDRKVS